MAETNKDIRRFKHDYSNMQIGLQKYLRENNAEEALKYISEENQRFLSSFSNKYHFSSGNDIVDAILSEKQAQIEEHNIIISFSGLFPSNLLSPVDLCIILGNTIDNAIEACMKFPDSSLKNIIVKSEYINGFLFIKISNPTARPVQFQGEFPLSNKSDQGMHGLGLYSIKKTIKKYDGNLTLSANGKTFVVDISMYIK